MLMLGGSRPVHPNRPWQRTVVSHCNVSSSLPHVVWADFCWGSEERGLCRGNCGHRARGSVGPRSERVSHCPGLQGAGWNGLPLQHTTMFQVPIHRSLTYHWGSWFFTPLTVCFVASVFTSWVWFWNGSRTMVAALPWRSSTSRSLPWFTTWSMLRMVFMCEYRKTSAVGGRKK